MLILCLSELSESLAKLRALLCSARIWRTRSNSLFHGALPANSVRRLDCFSNFTIFGTVHLLPFHKNLLLWALVTPFCSFRTCCRQLACYTISTPTLCGHILLQFSEQVFRSQVCRTAPNQSALESTDTGASSSGSNFEIQCIGTDLVSFEKAATKIEIRRQK